MEEKIRLHVGCGQNILPGYINIDGYDNQDRPDFFQTEADLILRAEELDVEFVPGSVEEIRCHHMLEHVSLVDLSRTLACWNGVLRMQGLLWIEVPDFGECARRILESDDEAANEIYYRHIFGSHFGPGEVHMNGFTERRLRWLLQVHGFEIFEVVRSEYARQPVAETFVYEKNLPLPDLTVKARKVAAPSPEVDTSANTPFSYRRRYPAERP